MSLDKSSIDHLLIVFVVAADSAGSRGPALIVTVGYIYRERATTSLSSDFHDVQILLCPGESFS